MAVDSTTTPTKTRPMLRVEERMGEPIEDVLNRLYHEQGKTMPEVAAILGVDAGTVSRWMAALGIEARFPGQRGKPAEAVA